LLIEFVEALFFIQLAKHSGFQQNYAIGCSDYGGTVRYANPRDFQRLKHLHDGFFRGGIEIGGSLIQYQYFGSRYKALARSILCLWPALSAAPMSPTRL
jgi:hypothetical protein